MSELLADAGCAPPPVLLVEDDDALREALVDALTGDGYDVHATSEGQVALELLEQRDFGLVLSDIRMPGMTGEALLNRISTHHPDVPVVLMTAHGSISGAVTAMQAGAVDYLQKPFGHDDLLDRVRRFACARTPDASFVSQDPTMQAVMQLAERVAATDVTALIQGESGTGKEVLARFIHNNSSRANSAFVAINCAAIPENLLEATLFGHERGAFTGAHQARPGKFEQATGGTLLLDEVTEMDVGLQAKLLRVIQERELERVGGTRTIALDVRLLATTNRDLREAVQAGMLREDLYYRLNVMPLTLPPLRERSADILPLARQLLRRAANGMRRPIPELGPTAEHTLLCHPWPGNVRELDNLMQRALVLQAGTLVSAEDLIFENASPCPVVKTPPPDELPGNAEDLRGHEQRVILETLMALNGNRQRVAEQLGISPRTLRYKIARMREQGLEIPGGR
ncbi:MAG: sigma-54 dependent transcriptional regulator [Pseudomonadota bacterium]